MNGRKVIAFTPAGRQRYMENLLLIMDREVARGHVDEWVLFDNCYNPRDQLYVQIAASQRPWITLLTDGLPTSERGAETIHRFYPRLRDESAIYVRIDDDIVYIDPEAIPLMVAEKIARPDAFLVFPVIVNNTRMSFWLQENGIIPEAWGPIHDQFLDPIAWRDPEFAGKLHRKALGALESGIYKEVFTIPSFSTYGHSPDKVNRNRISVNCFAINGLDMASCNVPWDEEGYLAEDRPTQLGRFNYVKGNAVVSHLAYHPQTERVEAMGLLGDYKAVNECAALHR